MGKKIDIDSDGAIVLRIRWKPTLKVLVVLIAATLSGFLPLPGLTDASRICLMIFIGAAGLWVTEAIPPFATAIMVIVLSVFLLGRPDGPMQNAADYRIFINPIASPVLALFFGGFVLALAASKHGFDVRLARAFIKPFGTRPHMVLLGVISITALFSMFMSNTATTAMMIAILAPVFHNFEGRDPFKVALVLSVPFAANIGGMGTIIGTPPNAVAASVLAGLGHPITFFTWMMFAVPIVIVLLLILWFLLITVLKPRNDHLELLFPEDLELTWDFVVVVITFTTTVTLWLTEPLHGIPSAVVALLPVMIFTMFGIINREDLRKIEWHILILVAGGLTLGVAMSATGLSTILVHLLAFESLSPVMLLVAITLVGLVISNFMSNTAAANLLIPITTSLTVISPALGGIAAALACSLAMSLPISTPPNAIAFATQEVDTATMAKYGTVVSLFGAVVVITALMLLQNWL
ncbi:MAG TPA: DASS family sodium-coupled anion symporter [candidate division Zixibacteria bacterium]|nr:DASS family sodium-coupled anion symporter [candidate division Zixibacteria bacterium]